MLRLLFWYTISIITLCLLQVEILYVYRAVIHYTVDKSNATYVTIRTKMNE